MEFKRKDVIKSIKKIIVPYLRTQGFRGTYPHFRRNNNDNGFDLLSFMFSRFGKSFFIEISVSYPYREKYSNFYYSKNKSKEEEIKRINVVNTFYRDRIKNDKDEWFDYTEIDDIDNLINDCLNKLKNQISWFNDSKTQKELKEVIGVESENND